MKRCALKNGRLVEVAEAERVPGGAGARVLRFLVVEAKNILAVVIAIKVAGWL